MSDILIVLGAGMLLVGVYLIYSAATLVVGGLLVLSAGLVRAAHHKRGAQ